MKKRFIITVCLIMSFTLLIGADNFLWEIENGKNKVYLLGSIHIMPEDTYPLDEKIETAFEEADILVVEVDITKIDQEKVQAIIVEKACYKEGKNLQT